MIISVSRRTDIPALYSKWFMKQINQGYCIVKNPFNSKQISEINLLPENIDFFVFWTRYPEPMIKYLPQLNEKGYKYYFMVTLNNYPKEFERCTPKIEKVIESIKKLARIIGKDKIVWRYDPILLNGLTNEEWHINNFSFIINELKDSISKIIISFIDRYRKNAKFLDLIDRKYKVHKISNKFLKKIKEISDKYNLIIQTCSENIKNSPIKKGACIDPKFLKLEKDFPKDPNQRKECLCARSKDIGTYNTCIFNCKYCYASNYNRALKYYIEYKLSSRHSAAAKSSSGGRSTKSSGIRI